MEPGKLHSVINLLQNQAAIMCKNEHLCVLSFDGTHFTHEWSCDLKNDTITDPKQRVQCLMLRELTKAWKQLVYYDFDKEKNKEILFDVIHKVEAAGFLVVAMVCGLGPSNMKLWKPLNININNIAITNPAALTRDTLVFVDAPHLLKLIRNNSLDHGFTLQGSPWQTVTNSSVQEIVSRSVHDLKTAHRLPQKHTYVQGTRRINMRLAAQLLSVTTTNTIKFIG